MLNIDATQRLTSPRGGRCKGCGSNSGLQGAAVYRSLSSPQGHIFLLFSFGLCRLTAAVNAPYISSFIFLFKKPWDILCQICGLPHNSCPFIWRRSSMLCWHQRKSQIDCCSFPHALFLLHWKTRIAVLRKCGQTSDMKVVIFIKSTCRAQPERGKSHVVFTVSMFARQLQTWISNYCHIVELNLHTKTCF